MVVRLVQTVVWFVACCGLVVFISLRFSGRPQIGVLVMDFALYVVSDVVSGGDIIIYPHHCPCYIHTYIYIYIYI